MTNTNKRSKYILFLFLLSLFIASTGFVPLKYRSDVPASEIDDILSRLPSENNAQLAGFAEKLFSLGPKGLKKICLRVQAPGESKDTTARYAISGLAVYAGRIENERRRRMLVNALADALRDHPNKRAKPFLIQMLRLTGRRDAVKPLSRCLKAPGLCRPAARALRSIGTAAAKKTLLKALKDAPVKCRITLVKHLGELRTQKIKKIIPYISHKNPELRQTALFALANSGMPEAEEYLLQSYVLSSPMERAGAPHLLLLYARRLAAGNRPEAALNLSRKIIENFRAPREIHIASAALSLIVDIQGKKAMPDLLNAAKSTQSELRGQAFRLAGAFKEEELTRTWIDTAENTDPDVKAEIIAHLGDCCDESAGMYILENLTADIREVRQAALEAAAACAQPKMLPDLINHVQTAPEADLPFITQALLRMPAGPTIAAAANIFPHVSPKAKIALLQVLSARRARAHSDLAFSQLENKNDELRETAFSSLENMVSASDISRLIDLLFQLNDRKEINFAQNALAASVNQIPRAGNRTAPVLEALKKAEVNKRIDFLRPLSKIGGQKALQAVVEAHKESDLRMKTAAVYTLSEWPEFSAAGPLLEIARKTKWRKHRYLALQGITRLVTESDLPSSRKVEWFNQVIALPQHQENVRVILSGLSKIKSREALSMAEGFYSWEGLEKETAWAVIQIILPSPEKEGMQGADLIPHLEKTLNIIQNEYDRERILRYIENLQPVRAKVTARISLAPAANSTRLHSCNVAPVV